MSTAQPKGGHRSWAVAVQLRAGQLTFAGQLGSAHAHAHAAVQLVLPVRGQVRLADTDGPARPVSAAVIPAGAVHTIHADHAQGVMVYLDPAGWQGRALTARLGQETGRLSPGAWPIAAWQAAAQPAAAFLPQADSWPADPVAALTTAGRVVAALTGPPPVPGALAPPDGILPTALAAVHHQIAAGAPVRLEAVAARVGLSASRLRHVFTEQLGLPFTTCVRWARLQTAMQVVRDGGTLTAAAHAAGFADSAHLTRVFHAMFGLAPSTAARHLHWH